MGKECKMKSKTFFARFIPYALNTIFSFSLLLALCSLLFIPLKLNAQLQGLPVTYLDSIIEDEEDGKLYFPSFVLTEPIKNEIYVIDSKNRIIIYASDFFPLFTLSKRNGLDAP